MLAPEHPYKWVNCVICFEAPGEHAIRLVALFDPRVKHTPSWQIHVRGYLMCAFHGLPDGNTLMQLAHKRDYPNCDCRLVVSESLPAMSHFAGNGGYPT